MENNNSMDKAYMALELTRLYIDKRGVNATPIFGKTVVIDSFYYFFKSLCGVDDISDYASIKDELELTKISYKELKEQLNNTAIAISQGTMDHIKKILQDCKGDMEPYVYDMLTDALK